MKEEAMARFKMPRNVNQEPKQLLQAKLDSSLVADINLLSKWSGNEKNFVVSELLRYALGQEAEFQRYKLSVHRGSAEPIPLPIPERREPLTERKSQPSPIAK
jgi:hypothetical protein